MNDNNKLIKLIIIFITLILIFIMYQILMQDFLNYQFYLKQSKTIITKSKVFTNSNISDITIVRISK